MNEIIGACEICGRRTTTTYSFGKILCNKCAVYEAMRRAAGAVSLREEPRATDEQRRRRFTI